MRVGTVLFALASWGAAAGAGETAPHERVRSLLEAQRWREALEVAREAAGPGADPETRAALGEALFRAGRLAEAGDVLGQVADLERAPARALIALARLRDAEGRPDDAIALARRAVEAAPDDPYVLYHASDSTTTRAEAIALLERYLEHAAREDPDRVEAARGAIRVYRALGDRPIWRTTARPERLALPLKLLWDPNGGKTIGWVVSARLAGAKRPVPLLLDSGSPGLLLIERVAKKRGFEPLAETTIFGGGGDRRHATRRGFFPSLAFEGLAFADVLATVLDDELDPEGRYHGILGLSAFPGYRVVLDLDGGKLRLEPSDGPLEGSPYWTVSGQWVVEADVGPSERGLFLFDTGATRTQVDLELAERVEGARLGPEREVYGVGGRLAGARGLSGVAVRFQAVATEGELRAVDLSMRSRLAGVQLSGFLGLDALDGRTIVVDTVQRRIAVR